MHKQSCQIKLLMCHFPFYSPFKATKIIPGENLFEKAHKQKKKKKENLDC